MEENPSYVLHAHDLSVQADPNFLCSRNNGMENRVRQQRGLNQGGAVR